MLQMYFQGFRDKEEETEDEIDYPFQVTIPAKESQEESSDESTSTDSSSDENLPGLLGEIAKKSKENHNLDSPDIKLTYFIKSDEDDFQSNNDNESEMISYIDIIQESNIEWAIELANQVQSKDNLVKFPSDEKDPFTYSQKFQSYKFKAISKKSPKIIRNVQNDFKMEPAMGETYVSPNESIFRDILSLTPSKNPLSKKRKYRIDESSDDALLFK